MTTINTGTWVWFPAEKGIVCGGQVTGFSKDNVQIKAYNGQAMSAPLSGCRPMHTSSIQDVDDMITLGDLHEGSLFHNLAMRFYKDLVYTYTGNILVAMNPFKPLPIYNVDVAKKYKSADFGALPPHIFAIANETYSALYRSNKSQCVVISGESGAGKTESTKLIIQFLAQKSNTRSLIQDQILEASPILEAFGNAKTVRNDNSSRFGKFIEVQFDKDGNIQGALILQFLLEKSRVVTQSTDERNYHIFYSMLAGASPEEKKEWMLGPVSSYNYLNKSGCVTVPTVNDAADYNVLSDAMKTLKFQPHRKSIFQTLSGILLLGNTTFVAEGDAAKIANPQALNAAAAMLGIEAATLSTSLLNKMTATRGETILSPLSPAQAQDSRDAISKALYGRMFSWIVNFINEITRNKKEMKFIGVLDIFGFEDFQVNSFEQFCINYANERLQLYFNHHIFKLEQEEYEKEKIDWKKIDFQDNQLCIDLIGKKPNGIIYLLDDESNFPKGTDQSFLAKCNQSHEKHPFFAKPKTQQPLFCVKHYAGEVCYAIDNFLEKNRDTLRPDLQDLLGTSKVQFIANLFPQEEVLMTLMGIDNATGEAPPTSPTGTASGTTTPSGSMRGGTVRKSSKAISMAAQFNASLNDLIGTLLSCNPYFVRCVKPNPKKVPNEVDLEMVTSQLKYSGMLETIRVRRAGYTVRLAFSEFLDRYASLGEKINRKDAKASVEKILRSFQKLPKDSWLLGVTKVFFKTSVEVELEHARSEKLLVYVLKIQRFARRVVGKVKRKRQINAIVKIQKVTRGYLARKFKEQLLQKVTKLQALWRGRKARKTYQPQIKDRLFQKKEKLKNEAVKKAKAEAKVQELAKKAKNGANILAEIENEDIFDGLSEEEKQRQKELLKYLEKSENSRAQRAEDRAKKTKGGLDNPDLSAEPVVDLPLELENRLMHDVLSMVPPLVPPSAGSYIKIAAVMEFERVVREVNGITTSLDSVHTLDCLSTKKDADERAALMKLQAIFCRDDQNLISSKFPLKLSLIRLSPELSAIAIDIYKAVLKFVYERNTNEERLQLINFMVEKAGTNQALNDEVLCQIVKQINENTNESAKENAWRLMYHASGLFAPSSTLLKNLIQYVSLTAPSDLNANIQRRLRRIRKNGARTFGYTSTEYIALESNTPIVLTAHFVDGNTVVFEADSATIGAEVVEGMLQTIQMQAPEGYVIFADYNDNEIRVMPYEHIFDTIARVERQMIQKSPSPRIAARPRKQVEEAAKPVPARPALVAAEPPLAPSPPSGSGAPTSPPPPPAVGTKPQMPGKLGAGSAPAAPPPPGPPLPGAKRVFPPPRAAPPAHPVKPAVPGKGPAQPSGTAYPWKLIFKRGYIYPCQNIDTYDFQLTFQQIITDMKKKNICPKEHEMMVKRLIEDDAKLEVIQAALEWPNYFSQFYQAKEKSFSFQRLELAIDQRGLHVVDASTDVKRIVLTCKYDDLVVKDVNETEVCMLFDDKEYTFHTRGIDVVQTINNYVVPLKFLSTMAMTVIDFPGFTPEHLSFKKGEIVSILDRDPENGWMQGQIGERVGWFPMEFGDILLEPYATGPDGKPVMRSAARNRAKEVAKQMAENKNTEQMLNISALLQEKYNMVEYAKEHFDERNLFESKSGVNAKIGTIKGTLAGTLRKKTGQDVIKITITEEIASKALSWTPTLPKYPLTRIQEATEQKLMVENFSNIMSYMGDIATKRRKTEIAMVITQIGMIRDKDHLRDELFIQLMKQATNNKSPKADSLKRCWDLMVIVTTFSFPSQGFEPYFRSFLHTSASNPNKDIAQAAHECDIRLTKSKMQPRALPPLESEIEAIERKQQLPLKVMFPEETSKSILFDSHTTTREILKKIFEKYDLPESNEYGLYVTLINGFVALPVLPNDKIMDIIYLAKMVVESERQRGPLATTASGEAFQIEFIRKLWLEQPLNASESLQNLIYHQIRKEFVKGTLLSAQELNAKYMDTLAHLIAITFRVSKGPDATFKTGDKESYFKDFIPTIANPKLSAKDWDNKISSELKKMNGKSDVGLRAEFLDVVKGWDLFGSSFFDILASNDPRFSAGGLLCVDGVGVRLLDRKTKEVIVSYSYDEIVNFRYDDNEFVMRTGDLMQKRIVRCQTNQGFVIADLIHSYVQYHLSKAQGNGGAKNE